MKTKCAKIFHFKCVYFRQSVSENSVFWTTFIHKCTVKTTDSFQCIALSWSKISDNRNNVHFSAVIFICNPYVVIKSALHSFGMIMTNEFLTP